MNEAILRNIEALIAKQVDTQKIHQDDFDKVISSINTLAEKVGDLSENLAVQQQRFEIKLEQQEHRIQSNEDYQKELDSRIDEQEMFKYKTEETLKKFDEATRGNRKDIELIKSNVIDIEKGLVPAPWYVKTIVGTVITLGIMGIAKLVWESVKNV